MNPGLRILKDAAKTVTGLISPLFGVVIQAVETAFGVGRDVSTDATGAREESWSTNTVASKPKTPPQQLPTRVVPVQADPRQGTDDLNAKYEAILSNLTPSHLRLLGHLESFYSEEVDAYDYEAKLRRVVTWKALNMALYNSLAGVPRPEAFAEDLISSGLLRRDFEGAGTPLTALGRGLLEYAKQR